MILETVRVINPSGEGYMLINATDFDPSTHQLFKEIPAKIKAIPDEPLPEEPETVAPDEEVVSETKRGRPFSKTLKK